MKTALISAATLLLLFSSCSNTTPIPASDSTAYLAETVVGSLNSALTNDERATIGSGSSPASSLEKKASRRALAATLSSCGSNQYSPALGSASCAGTVGSETVTSNLDCNVSQNQDLTLRGTVVLTFDSAATCNSWLTAIPTTGSVTWTSSAGETRVTSEDAAITTTSGNYPNYANVTYGGGIKTAFGSPLAISIEGLHVVRQAVGQGTIYDHSIHLVTPLSVSGTEASGNLEIASGSVTVDHNLDKYTATGTISNLQWSASCCVPTSGTIDFALTGSRTGSVSVDFSTGTCGSVKVSDASQLVSASPKPGASPTPVVSTQAIGGCQ